MSQSQADIMRILVVSHGAGAGKTSLIKRFVDDTFDHEYTETTGNIYSKKFTVDDEFVCLQILDTAGDPRLSNIAEESMKFADAFMIVYSMCNPDALQASVSLKFSIAQQSGTINPPMILVGTKSDLVDERKSKLAATMIARSWDCDFVATSAKTNVNVDDAFVQLIRQHRSQRRPILHESRSSSIFSNVFPRLRSWTSASSSTQYSRVIKRGWMEKRGFVVPNWKNRYVVICEDGSLQYFANEKNGPDVYPLGEISLRDVWQIVEYCDEENGHEDGFILQTKDRDWYFSCSNEMEKQAWLDVIVRLIADFASMSRSSGSASTVSSDDVSMAFDRTVNSAMSLDSSDGLSLLDKSSQ